MEYFDRVVEFVFNLVGLDKHHLKAVIFDAGLGPAWIEISRFVAALGLVLVPLCFCLEHWLPAVPRQRILNPHIVFDFVSRGIFATATLGVTGVAYAAMNVAFKTWFPELNTGLLDGQPIAVQALGAFLITDFMFYVSHRIHHEVRWLWHFHAVHHSQRYLTPLTAKRAHPFEIFPKFVVRAWPIAFVGGDYPAWFLFGVVNNFWGFFIHSNVKINLGWLGKFIVSPQFHRLHHSIEGEHFDHNYGERLVLWDWLFGSRHPDVDAYPHTGVPGTEWTLETQLSVKNLVLATAKQFAYPFVMIARSIRRFAREQMIRA